MKKVTEKTIEGIKEVSFPGKEVLLDNLEVLRVTLAEIKTK
jgi:hypothetical protein